MIRLSFAPILLLLTLSWTTVGAERDGLYLDPGRPVEERVAGLLARMTLAEKIGQMTQINLSRLMGDGEWDRGPLNHEWLDRLLVEGATGSLLSGGGAAPLPNTPVSWAETINELQRIAVESTRLGIPILYGVDAVHGHNNVSGATIYVDAAAAASIEGRGLGGGGLALRSALAGITLLENRRGALPLSDTQRLLVAGADDAAMQLGGWTIEWQGLGPGDDRAPATTVLRGLREQAPSRVAVEPLPRLTAAAGPTALRADAVVLVLGEPPYAEGAGDSDTLGLPEEQLEQARLLVTGLDGSDAKLIVVLFAGRPILLPGWLTEASDALLMAYLPGSEGGSAVAQVLFGGVSPAGRLPFSWPREVGQLPLAGGALPAESGSEPRYRFGHGLSYTMFRYRNLRAEQADAGVVLTVTVENAGDTAGDEVVLAFAGFPTLPRITPDRVLAGFERVTLAPGEARDVSVAVPWTALALVPGDADAGGVPQVMVGEYRFEVGRSVSHVDLQGCMPTSCRQGGGSRE